MAKKAIAVLFSFIFFAQSIAGADQSKRTIDFLIVKGNAPLSDARVILLGETHLTLGTRANSTFLGKHAKPGDYVLIEAAQTLETVSPNLWMYRQLLSDTPNASELKVLGWDDHKSWERSSRLGEKIAKLALKQFRGEPVDLNLFKGYQSRVTALYELRNQFLVASIKTLVPKLLPGQKIWVLGGGAHTEDPSVLRSLSDIPFLSFDNRQREIMNAEELKSYALEINLETFQQYTERRAIFAEAWNSGCEKGFWTGVKKFFGVVPK